MEISNPTPAPFLHRRGVRRILAVMAAGALALTLAPWPSAQAADDSLILISATSLDRNTVHQSYTLTVVNTGAVDHAPVALADTAPDSADIVDFVADTGRYLPSTRRWYVGTLRPGGSATLTVFAR